MSKSEKQIMEKNMRERRLRRSDLWDAQWRELVALEEQSGGIGNSHVIGTQENMTRLSELAPYYIADFRNAGGDGKYKVGFRAPHMKVTQWMPQNHRNKWAAQAVADWLCTQYRIYIANRLLTVPEPSSAPYASAGGRPDLSKILRAQAD